MQLLVISVIRNRFITPNVSAAQIERQKDAVRKEKLEKMKKHAYQKAYKQMQILLAKREGRHQAIREINPEHDYLPENHIHID